MDDEDVTVDNAEDDGAPIEDVELDEFIARANEGIATAVGEVFDTEAALAQLKANRSKDA